MLYSDVEMSLQLVFVSVSEAAKFVKVFTVLLMLVDVWPLSYTETSVVYVFRSMLSALRMAS